MKKSLVIFTAGMMCLAAFADLYMAGDSTMCNYNPQRQYPQQGWGQALEQFMKNPDELHNWAIGGRSARSYKNEGRWQKLVDALKPGDFVIIAFGHNDANRAKTERYSTPEEYKEFMRGFVADVRGKNATPVFATSIPHSGGFSEKDGVMHVRGSAAGIGPYVEATVQLGQELGVSVLDLNRFACEVLPKYGLEKSYKLYMRIQPGEYERLPNGSKDGCHTRDAGAYFFAKAAVELAYKDNLPIAKLFKNPRDVHFVPVPYGGPGGAAKPLKDDFSKEEIAYANEGVVEAGEASKNEKRSKADIQRELMDLRRSAEGRGMNKDDAMKWAAQEFHRRHGK